MSITVIVSVIAYQALDSVLNIVKSEEVQEEKIKKMGLFFTVFNKDFQQIVPRKVRNAQGNGFNHALFYNKEATPMLEFTRGGWGNPAPENFQRSHLQRVAYHLDDEKLIRKTWRAVDRYEDTTFDEVVLLEGVTGFKMRFLSNNSAAAQNQNTAQQNGQKSKPWEWVEQWPANQPKQGNQYNAQGQIIPQAASEALPISIEIELEVTDWGKLRRVYEMVGGS